ncbi:pentapeptide repeat-containing protein [Campylobacter coli]|uniref:pentapeptide repeat-containing protein n=1 Tax=Campylobacter coli TaxID=195 RepID=UPI0009317A59|nr:pentapeptide repeat-containing protein [Campylobacter coli]
MRRDMYNIDLEIPNSGIFIKGLDNEKLTISLDLIKFMEVNRSKIASSGNKLDIGKLTKPLNPYIIYNILEENNKNNFNGVKIIDKIEDNNNIVYCFNFGLILNTFIGKSKPPRWINQNTSDNLKELNEIKAFIAPCFFSYEIIGDVTSIPPSELEDLKNDYGYEGKDYKSIFKNEVYINFSCYERMYFSNCEFKSKVSLHIIDNDNTVSFLNGIDFSNCIFEDEINFKRFISGTSLPENKYYNNEQDTLFKNCIFKKRVDFHNSNFFNSIYFNNSHFKDYVDFHECEFKKTACFYGVRFDKTPNFSQAIFKENLNVVNTNLNFTFGNLQERIKQEYKDFNETNEKKSLDKFANDFRDSFRTFKNALIKDNNLLDASNFHKYELYCKELELENKKVTTFKDIVDRYQLFFYRKLCDHHTDLLLNAKWLLYIVALYVLLLGKMIWVYPVLIIIFLASIYLCKIKNIWLNLSSITVLIAIVCCPKMIFGFTNLFTSNLNYWQNLITTVYVVVIGLVIFSLQKTARKNSIVPS